MGLKQKKRFLVIDTVLENPESDEEDDNFVLIQARGAEGISFPYAFDLALVGPRDKRPEPATMIGSRARFGVKHILNEGNDDDFDYIRRHGIIEAFIETGAVGDFRSYAARLVPAFRLTGYETRFRVFEDRTLEAILHEVLDPYPEIEINLNALHDEAARLIPYCVQFGESTFNFVHRLLDRFGIFYRFEHELNDQREVMVLGSRLSVPARNADVVNLQAGPPTPRAVVGFRKSFSLATRRAKVGNFNEINPATPFRGQAEIAKDYDLAGEHPALEAEAFPTPVTVTPEPRDYADRRMRQNEGGVFGATGQTQDVLFRAGRTFIVSEDKTAPEDGKDTGEKGKTYLLKTLSLFAYDHSALVNPGRRLLDLIKGLLGFGSDGGGDVATAAAQALLDQVKKDVDSGKEIFTWLDNQAGASNPSGLPDFISSALGRGGSALAGAIPLLVATATTVKDLLDKLFAGANDISIAFDALPMDAPFLRDVVPTPAATKPVAYGPHLALVIGPDGIDNATRDIFTDALGRVRIRFPWDPGPDNPNDPIGKDAILTGRNTCFVRVSDGWAGERLGLQFIPRIGQEVVVGFIDGDPERPMVVGRAYNARGGSSQLPFLPSGALGKSISVPADLKGTETDAATRSGIRTKTTPRKPEGQSGFHMLRLDDKQGEEQFLMRSERRMDMTAFGSRFDTTRGNLNILVGGGTQEPGKPPPGGAMATTAGGTYDLHIGKQRYEKIDAEWETTVDGYKMSEINGDWITYADGAAKISAPSITLQASDKITLHVGSSRIVITPATIFVHAAMLRENQEGPMDLVTDTEITEAADAAVADPGEPPDFLARLPKGGGGRRKHGVASKKALSFARGPDNKIHVMQPGHKPGGIVIDDKDPDFADRAASDLNNIAKTDDGMNMIGRINRDTSKPVTIEKPAKATNPPTAGFRPGNKADATQAGEPTGQVGKDGQLERGTGTGSGGSAVYDPKDWPREGDPNSPDSTQKLHSVLQGADMSQQGQVPPNQFGGQAPPSPPPPAPSPAPTGSTPATGPDGAEPTPSPPSSNESS